MNTDDVNDPVFQIRCVDSHLRSDDVNSTFPLDDSEAFEYGFIRFAPPEMSEKELQENPLFVAESEDFAGDLMSRAAIRWRYKEFKKTGDPVSAIESILLAMQHGVYPPVPVLKWLSQGLEKWYEEQGKLELGKALGLTVGKGREPPFKRALQKDRNDMLMFDMDRLMYLGATRMDAATMVSERLKDEDWNRSRWDIKDLDAETLKTLHATQHTQHIFASSADKKNPLNDPLWVASWLAKFSPLYMPLELKSML